MIKGTELKEKAIAALEWKKAQIRFHKSYKTVMGLLEEAAEQGYMSKSFSMSRMVDLFGEDNMQNLNAVVAAFAVDDITVRFENCAFTFSWE